MHPALKDPRGIACIIAIIGGIASYTTLSITGHSADADKALAIATSALAFIVGFASDPKA